MMIKDPIIQIWNVTTMRVDNSIVEYEVDENDNIWIYFAYAPTNREFYTLVKVFSDKYPKQYYDTILFRTEHPDLFANHSKHIKEDVYQWER